VKALTAEGHQVIIEKSAGEGSSISDEEYKKTGARIAETKEEILDKAELTLKVKEPLPSEYHIFKEGQILFTYLHLASNRSLLSGKTPRRKGYSYGGSPGSSSCPCSSHRRRNSWWLNPKD